jgi:hypothetical protein
MSDLKDIRKFLEAEDRARNKRIFFIKKRTWGKIIRQIFSWIIFVYVPLGLIINSFYRDIMNFGGPIDRFDKIIVILKKLFAWWLP